MQKIVSLSSGGKSSNTHGGGGGGGIRRNSRARQPTEELLPNSWERMDPIELLSDYNYPATATITRRTPPYKRRLTGYCGWKIWNTNSGKTCDQVAQELVTATNTNSNNNNDNDATILLTVAQAKSQILPEGCICGEGEKSFDDTVITPMAFCGKCRYRNASFTCDDRVEFVMTNYPEDNPTLNKAKMNLLRRGDCIDRNWTPYALKVEINDYDGGGGLSAGAIAGIVLAALALCCASMVGCCILRDLKKVKSNNGGEEGDTEMKGSAVAVVAKEKLNVIEEGDEGEEEESVMESGGVEMSVSAGSSVPQSKESDGMADDVTEIITNGRNRGE